MYHLVVAADIQKRIRRVDNRYRAALIEAFKTISANPLSGKPLSGELKGQYSYRVGVYRIVYTFNPPSQIVVITDFDHCKNVYR